MESENNGQASIKAPKVRSVAYPSVSIKAAVELTAKIDSEFTDVVFTPREHISNNLKVSGGALDRNLSSCVQYGLLELKSKVGYKPTPLFKKIKRPLPDENVLDLYRECLHSPELYKKLIKDFNEKQLPTISGFANILDRLYSVKGEAAEKAARVFINNLQLLELIGEDNILKIEGGITPIEEVNEEEFNTNTPPEAKSTFVLLPPPEQKNESDKKSNIDNNKFKEIPVFLKNGKEAKILLPIDFTDDDIIKVSKVLKGYLPD